MLFKSLLFGVVCISSYGLYKSLKPPPLISPHIYSIHLMWINKKYNHEQTYIFPEKQMNNIVIDWARKNPESIVNVWYDDNSSFLNKSSIENTLNYFEKENVNNVCFKSIRDLERVKKNERLFNDDIPVYFRSDIIRAFIAEDIMIKNKEEWFVYADMDVETMDKKEIFDNNTIRLVNKYGFVMAYEANVVQYENSFQIYKYTPNLLKALQTMVIDVNIARGYEFINDINEKNNVGYSSKPSMFSKSDKIWKIHNIAFQHNVYYSYPLMFEYLHELNTYKGYEKNYNIDGININARLALFKSSALQYIFNNPMPTKKVKIPTSISIEKELND